MIPRLLPLLLAGCAVPGFCPVDFDAPEFHVAGVTDEPVNWRDLTLDTTVPRLIKVAVVGDAELSHYFANADVAGMVAEVDELYRRELGTEVELVYLKLHTWDDDPFVAEGHTAVLREFRDWRVAQHPESEAHAWILCTGRRIRVGGLGYPSTICYPSLGHAVIHGISRRAFAHELGHIIGMAHEVDTHYLMAPSGGNVWGFHEDSLKHYAYRLLDPRVTCLEPEYVEHEVPFRRGDLTNDGKVDLGDVLKLLDRVSGRLPGFTCPDAADVNDDGRESLEDAIKLLSWLYQGGDPPPPPFTEPGLDPTPDKLGCER
jgi:hypothetical protein